MASLSGFIRKLRRADPLTDKVANLEKNVPGSMGAALESITAEGVSTNPFSADRARTDIFAGGAKLSQDPEARSIGRMIGSAFAGWFGAGALGAGATGATSAATGAVQLAQGMEAVNVAKRMAEEEEARQRDFIAQMRGEQAKEVAAIPIADAETLRRNRRRSLASIMQRRGRQSTILTGGGQGLLGA
jgi:hypothetical protein